MVPINLKISKIVLGCFVQFMGSIGVLVTFSLGAVMDWKYLALVSYWFFNQKYNFPSNSIYTKHFKLITSEIQFKTCFGSLFIPERRWLLIETRAISNLKRIEI